VGATEGCNDGLGLGTNVGLAIVGDIVVGDTVGIAVWSGVGDIVVGDTVAAVGSSVGKGLTEYAFTATSGELQICPIGLIWLLLSIINLIDYIDIFAIGIHQRSVVPTTGEYFTN